ncbi:MAG: hypothetical protein AAGA77_20550, partial [Bacteroidota bacterium]
ANPDDPLTTACPYVDTEYTLTLLDGNGNVESVHTFTVDVKVDPEVYIAASTRALCSQGSANLSVENQGTFTWTKEDGEVIGYEAEIDVDEPGVYIVNVVTPEGCEGTGEIKIYDFTNTDDIQAYFVDNGFYSVPIWREDVPGLNGFEEEESSACNLDEIKYIEDGTSTVSLFESITTVLNTFKPLTTYSNQVVTTENSCLCDQGLSKLTEYESEFMQGEVAAWGHTFFAGSDDLAGIEYIKGRMLFEPSLPLKSDDPNFDHFAHMEEIHQEILDQNTGAEEHSRVMHSNVYMPNPVEGYQPDGQCDIPSNMPQAANYFSSALVPFQLPVGATEVYFSGSESSSGAMEGTVVKFTLEDESWQGYFRRGIETFFYHGYYHDIKATFYETFQTELGECGFNEDCTIDVITVTQSCDGTSQCEFSSKTYSNEDFENDGSYSSAGYNLPILQQSLFWENAPIDWEESGIFINQILCDLQNLTNMFRDNIPDENQTIEVVIPEEYKGRVIFARDIHIGGEHFDFAGITLPSNESVFYLNPMVTNDHDYQSFDIYKYDEFGHTLGFRNSYIISELHNREVRLNFFNASFNVEDKLEPSYMKADWTTYKYPEIKNCITSSFSSGFEDFYLDPPRENLLIFVNGYRKKGPWEMLEEGKISENETNSASESLDNCNVFLDKKSYWGDLGNDFMNTIGTWNVLYVDGHNSIANTNHKSFFNLVKSIEKCNLLTLPDNCFLPVFPIYHLSAACAVCELNDTPNEEGFETQYNLGRAAGAEFMIRLNLNDSNGDKIFVKRNEYDKITGRIDIVAHSMGYAYAKGMLDYIYENEGLEVGNRFGNFYIIQPENPQGNVSGNLDPIYTLDLSIFSQVVHFSSKFESEKLCRQDGIAPQTFLNTDENSIYIDWPIFIPDTKHCFLNSYTDKEVELRRFLNAHYVENQFWIFDPEMNPNLNLIFPEN